MGGGGGVVGVFMLHESYMFFLCLMNAKCQRLKVAPHACLKPAPLTSLCLWFTKISLIGGK